MKKLFIIMFVLALLGVNSGSATDSPIEALAKLFPPDALVFVGTPSLKNLLPTIQEHPLMKKFQMTGRQENEESAESGEEVATSINTTFRQSRLYLKLEKKLDEASKLAGFDISLKTLSETGGEETALALYDIGEMSMVFLSAVSRSQIMKSKFAEPGKKFEERKKDDVIYYVASDETGAVFSFAITDKWFLFSNNLGLMERTIDLITGKNNGTLADSVWFKGILEPSILSADLVVALNQSALNDDLYFRTYWLHRNAKQLKWIGRSALALKFEQHFIRETRVFSIADGTEQPFGVETSSELARIPSGAMWLDVRADENPRELTECLVKWILGDSQSDNRTFSSEISRLFEEARPAAAARLSAPYIEKNGFYKDQRRLLAIRLKNAGAFDKRTLLNKIAERLSQSAGVGGLVSATVVNKGGIEVVSLPLLEERGPAFFMKDSTFIASNDYSFIRDYLSAPSANISKNDVLYFKINFAVALPHLSDIYQHLGELPNWTSYDSQPFFRNVLPSLFDIISVVKSAVSHGYIRDKTFVEEVVYYL